MVPMGPNSVLVGGIALEGFGIAAFLEKVCNSWQALRFQKPAPGPVSLPSGYLWTRYKLSGTAPVPCLLLTMMVVDSTLLKQ